MKDLRPLQMKKSPVIQREIRVLEGKSRHVIALAFSPDGKRLASGSKDKTVRLWDTDTDTELTILRKHKGWISTLAFAPNGKMLASGSTDKTVHLWDTDAGELIMTLTGHLSGIAALSFSPDGKMLASGSIDGTIRFWNTETGDLLPINITEHTEWVKAVSFIKDSSTLASVAFNGIITFWDLETSQKTDLQMTGHRDFLPILAFSPNGTQLASIDVKAPTFLKTGSVTTPSIWMSDNLVRLTDVTTGRELATLHKANAGAYPSSDITFSPDGKTVAFGRQSKIHLWNTETGTSLDISLLDERNPNESGDLIPPRGAMLLHMSQPSALVFSPDGKKLVSGTVGGKVQMWDAETGVALAPLLAGQNMDEKLKKEPNKMRVNYQDIITTLTYSSDGTLLAVGSQQKIRLLGSSKQPPLKSIPRGVKSLVFSPNDTVLVAGLRDGRIELLDMTTGKKMTTLNGHTQTVETLVFSPDGKTLVSTGQDGTILVWDWEEALKNAIVSD